jgi:hypothetical protein
MRDFPLIENQRHFTGARLALPRRLNLIAVLFLFYAQTFSAQEKADRVHPLRFGKISFDQRKVFEESDSASLRIVGSVANSVHVLTDEEVIRWELLFDEGDVYDNALVDESEQNLKGLGIVNDVAIVRDTLPDRTVDIMVKTRDRWTLRPGLSLRQEGDRGGLSVSVRDENFLGDQRRVSLAFSANQLFRVFAPMDFLTPVPEQPLR